MLRKTPHCLYFIFITYCGEGTGGGEGGGDGEKGELHFDNLFECYYDVETIF